MSLWMGAGTRYCRAVRPTKSFVKLEHIIKRNPLGLVLEKYTYRSKACVHVKVPIPGRLEPLWVAVCVCVCGHSDSCCGEDDGMMKALVTLMAAMTWNRPVSGTLSRHLPVLTAPSVR